MLVRNCTSAIPMCFILSCSPSRPYFTQDICHIFPFNATSARVWQHLKHSTLGSQLIGSKSLFCTGWQCGFYQTGWYTYLSSKGNMSTGVLLLPAHISLPLESDRRITKLKLAENMVSDMHPLNNLQGCNFTAVRSAKSKYSPMRHDWMRGPPASMRKRLQLRKGLLSANIKHLKLNLFPSPSILGLLCNKSFSLFVQVREEWSCRTTREMPGIIPQKVGHLSLDAISLIHESKSNYPNSPGRSHSCPLLPYTCYCFYTAFPLPPLTVSTVKVLLFWWISWPNRTTTSVRRHIQSSSRRRASFTTLQYTAPVTTVAIKVCNKTAKLRLAHIYAHLQPGKWGDHTHKSD